MNANYTFEDGITVNADCLQRAEEKHDKIEKVIKYENVDYIRVGNNVYNRRKHET